MLMAVVLLASACGHAQPTAHDSAAHTVIALPAAPPAAPPPTGPASSAAADDTPTPAPAPCLPMHLAPSSCHTAREVTSALDGDELEAWLVARGAKGAAARGEHGRCKAERIGASNEDALFCEVDTQRLPSGIDPALAGGPMVVTNAQVLVVRSGRVVTVLDAIVRLDGLHVFDMDGAEGPLFALVSSRSPTNDELTIAEPAVGACAEAARTAKHDDGSFGPDPQTQKLGRAWRALHAQLVAKMCASAGRYAWKNQRFTR